MGQGRGFKWLAQSLVAMDSGWFEATGSITYPERDAKPSKP